MAAFRPRWLPAATGLLLLLLCSVVLTRLWSQPPLRALFPYSQAVLAADGSLLRLTTAADEQYRYWLPLEQIDPVLTEALLMQEDRWFYYHPGVNPVSLIRGALITYSGGARQGGSTLTMQLARLIRRESTRTPLAKLQQVADALWLEWRYSKHEILEAYLNFAPFGGNIQGAGAAAWLYFGKPAHQLTTMEAATLAVIPQQPALRPRNATDTQAAVERLLVRWRQFRPQRLGLSQSPPRQSYRPHPPFLAPHATDLLLSTPGQPQTLHSTLEPALQRLLERHLQLARPELQRKGISNAAAMLVHWPSRRIQALVGSLDYHDAAHAGQVNGVTAKRSPGSTLKPLLYALALEQGMIHPHTILKDAPQAFGAYTPENYDGGFAGPVSATRALNSSRNIPAVALAAGMPAGQDLHNLLRRAGVSRLLSREHYGLALVLGAGEVSLYEQARLYTLLANHGQDAPLQLLHSSATEATTPLLTPQASYLVLDMLAANPRPGLSQQARQHPWFTAWKTGTSWSYRDAWTAGVVGSYVLVVWAGNFDGSPNPALVGIQTAAPLWWRIAEGLPAVTTMPEQYRLPPEGLAQVDVCTASGDLPNDACPQRTRSWFIPAVSPIRVSDLHQRVWVDRNTGAAVCPPYDPARHEQRLFEFWPSELASLFARAGLPRRQPPLAQCDIALIIREDNAPRILSPYTGMTFMLGAVGAGATAQLPLQADAAAGVQTLYWLLENRLLGQSAPGAILYWRPEQPGRYQLTVSDDQGRSSSRWVDIGVLP